jgi:acyl carrier protein
MILRWPIGDTENPSRATEPAWDSPKHLEIAFLLEDHFDFRLSDQEIANLRDIEQIVTLLEARCGTVS